MRDNLVFDLGVHTGQDTDFYLKKGFNVVAVEANPDLCEEIKKRFKTYIKSGQLKLINRAISNEKGNIKFYIHPIQKDWSSCFKEYIFNSEEVKLKEIEVEGITLSELFDLYSIPRYMKVDIEGADVLVAKQLSELINKPKYVSFETSRRDYAKIFSYLLLSGYSKFQLINQLKYANLNLKNINKEGNIIDYTFEFGASGVFGLDLDQEKWIDYNELLSRYIKYIDLRCLDQENLSMGWLDVHASL